MREFRSFREFSQFMGRVAKSLPTVQKRELEREARGLEREAQAMLGTYQTGVVTPHYSGDWAELAQATKDDRVRKGFSEDDPLRRTGELAAAITHDVPDAFHARVGVPEGASGSDGRDLGMIACVQELGNEHVPPRPFLSHAASQHEEEIVRRIGEALVAHLSGTNNR